MGVWLLIYFFDHQTVHIPISEKGLYQSNQIETQARIPLSIGEGAWVGLV